METNTIPTRRFDGVDYGEFKHMVESKPFQTVLKIAEGEARRALTDMAQTECDRDLYRLQGRYSAWTALPVVVEALLERLKPEAAASKT